jgi:hypothetical protein
MPNVRLSRSLYVSSVLIIVAGIFGLFWLMQTNVAPSFTSTSMESEDPQELLDLATTYYRFARARHSSVPDFEHAIILAKKAVRLSLDRFASELEVIDNRPTPELHEQHLDESEKLIYEAEQLIKESTVAISVGSSKLGNLVPFYADLMWHDNDYMEDHAPRTRVSHQIFKRGLKKIESLGSPDDREVPVSDRIAFAIVVAPQDEPILEELAIQHLSANTKMYTITPKLVAGLMNRNVISMLDVVQDDSLLRALASELDAEEIALFTITRQHEVDGIHTFGIRLGVWSAESMSVAASWYTEVIVKDRVFNQILPFILPLLLACLAMAALIDLSVGVFNASLVAGSRPQNLLRTSVQSRLTMNGSITFVAALTVFVALMALLVHPFLNPSPDAGSHDPLVEAWRASFPLVMLIIPGLLTYALLGKLDQWIEAFGAGLGTTSGLFQWSMGNLMLIPSVLTYLQILRFGFEPEVWLFLPLIAMLVPQAWLFSHHVFKWSRLPWQGPFEGRAACWMAYALHVGLVLVTIHFLFTDYTYGTLARLALLGHLPVLLMSLMLKRLAARVGFSSNREMEMIPHPVLPVQFQTSYPRIIETSEGYRILLASTGTDHKRQTNSDLDKAELLEALAMEMPKGIQPDTFVEQFLLLGNGDPASSTPSGPRPIRSPRNMVHVDFSQEKPSSIDVHYYPFAYGFREFVSKGIFNDAADKARKAGSILGKLVGSVSSIGSVLEDGMESRPRRAEEVAEDLMGSLGQGPSILLFSHLEMANLDALKDSYDLFRSVLQALEQMEPSARPLTIIMFSSDFRRRADVTDFVQRLQSHRHVAGRHSAVDPVMTIRYDKPAFDVLENKQLPIQARIALSDELEKQNKAASPEVVEGVLRLMERSGALRMPTDPHEVFGSIDLDDIRDLPEFEAAETVTAILSGESIASRVLLAAAYAANEAGRFHLQLLESMTEVPRMELLHILRELEGQGILNDIRGEEQYGWFAFSDRRFITEITETENSADDRLSQVTREFYRRYVLYHCPSSDWKENEALLESGDLKLGRGDLFILAQRAMKSKVEFPIRALGLNEYAARSYSKPGIARFDYALTCIDNVLSMRQDGATDIRHLILKLRILNELRSDPRSADDLVSRIERMLDGRFEGEEAMTLDPWDQQQAILVIANHCVVHFNDKNASKGLALCEEVIQKAQDKELMIRGRFYKLKLIPGKTLRLSNDRSEADQAVLDRLVEMRNEYLELLKILSSENDRSDTWVKLHGEVLNDYAGSFLTDKWMSIADKADQSPDDPQFRRVRAVFETKADLVEEIERHLFSRLQLAGYTDASTESIRETNLANLESRLFSDSEMDRRGLCYTLNYLNRAYFMAGDYARSIDIGKLSFKLNRHVHDLRGGSIVSGYLGKAIMALTDQETIQQLERAFKWQERSFGYAWLNRNEQGALMSALAMQDIVNSVMWSPNEEGVVLKARARVYLRQLELRHLLRHLDSRLISAELGRSICMSRDELHEVSAKNPNRSVFSIDFISNPTHILTLHDAFYHHYRDHKERLEEQGELTLKANGITLPVRYTLHQRIPLGEGVITASIAYSLHFEHVVGTDHLVYLANETERASCVRGVDAHHPNILGIPRVQPVLTNTMVGVIEYKCPIDSYHIKTTFPGRWAPKYPEHCNTELEKKESLDFWEQHAMIMI